VYSTIPGDSGKSVRWDFKIEGDLLTSWILGPDGQRVNQVKCRKLGEWNATGETSFHNGVWEYLSLKGIYLHSGSYGGWFILNKPIETSGTVQSRASNFDAVNVAIVVGTRRQDDRYIWNVVHAVDQRMEGESYITTGNSMQLPKSALWFVDNNGKTVGEAIRTIRIAQ
jgi:hypothetical protein